MPMIVGVRFGAANKIYYFDPKDIQFSVGDNVIVETVRGLEYAKIGQANTIVEQDKIVGELKPVVRKATKDDDKRHKENIEKKAAAFDLCAKKIQAHGLKMHLVDAEYTFDRSKVVFSFTADGRVDFRELVKDLASEMKMRIELRQIYERDDVKIKGAMGMCGRECCCLNCQSHNERATVKMAKNQNISLNPSKVSGMCGKLMCCLRYENDYYAAMAKVMPKVGTSVKVDKGIGNVVETDVLRERVKVAVQKEDGISQEYYKVGEFVVIGRGEVKAEDDKDDESDTIKDSEQEQ
ncbi:MAG: stage 0 sporulation family protein [Christensenellales bacterium]